MAYTSSMVNNEGLYTVTGRNNKILYRGDNEAEAVKVWRRAEALWPSWARLIEPAKPGTLNPEYAWLAEKYKGQD